MEQLLLVEAGQPKATLVVGSQASPQAKEAAEILQSYLEQISGGRLFIRTENETVSGSRILVGHSEAVRKLGVNAPSGVTSQMNEEGFLIKTVGNDLIIAGNEDWHYRGTIFGVYDFLERLGCRWFFPGDYGEIVPKMSTVTTDPLDIEEHPSFRLRNIWYSGWMPVSGEDSEALVRWYDCNKAQRLHISLPGDGSVTRLAPPERYFESHTHIYALDRNGEPHREMLCLSEPEAVDIAVKTIIDAFRSDSTMFTFGFAPPDGRPVCHCERCQERLHGIVAKHLGSPSLSDPWFYFVNEVAKRVQAEFPERWLLTNGYANRVYPPEGVADLASNFGIQFAVLQSCTLHRIGDPRCWQRQDYAEILQRWTDANHPVIIYDYDPGVGLENLPFPALHNLKHDLPLFKQHGVWGFWTEGQNTWMRTHLNYYIRAKLMWNAEADVDALVRDYCETFYGAAADAVERYIWSLENAFEQTNVHAFWRSNDEIPWRLIFTDKLVQTLGGYLKQAAQLANTDAHQSHLNVLQIAHDHLVSYLDMRAAADSGNYRQALSHADKIRAARDKTAEIDPTLLPNSPDWVARTCATSLEGTREIYQHLADRAGGELGELAAMLPKVWKFRTDPFDDGLIRRWYLPDKAESWETLNTTLYWENQGYQDEVGRGYVGLAWYQTKFDAPAWVENRPLKLGFGGVCHNKIWVWINGLLIYYNDSESSQRPFDVDVTRHIAPGQTNHIAVRIQSQGVFNRAQGGIYRRAFLWSPRESA